MTPSRRPLLDVSYAGHVPRLWTQTIEAHRNAVRDAIIRTTVELAAATGLRSVTMSKVAEVTGIGRATLYKYFADVEAIMLAWHERQIQSHLHQLAEAAARPGSAWERLEAVFEACALISHGSHGHDDSELVAFLHGDSRVARAESEVRDLIRRSVMDAISSGDVRADVTPDELVNYCLHALAAARRVRTKAAVRRLVMVTLAGMRPPTQR